MPMGVALAADGGPTDPEDRPKDNFVLLKQAARRPWTVPGNPWEGFKEAEKIIEWRILKGRGLYRW